MPRVYESQFDIDADSGRLYYLFPAKLIAPYTFTGWKYCGFESTGGILDVVRWDDGFVAQIISYHTPPDGLHYYVNLPGMACGEFKQGGLFDVGTERVYADATKPQIEELVRYAIQTLQKKLAAR